MATKKLTNVNVNIEIQEFSIENVVCDNMVVKSGISNALVTKYGLGSVITWGDNGRVKVERIINDGLGIDVHQYRTVRFADMVAVFNPAEGIVLSVCDDVDGLCWEVADEEPAPMPTTKEDKPKEGKSSSPLDIALNALHGVTYVSTDDDEVGATEEDDAEDNSLVIVVDTHYTSKTGSNNSYHVTGAEGLKAIGIELIGKYAPSHRKAGKVQSNGYFMGKASFEKAGGVKAFEKDCAKKGVRVEVK